MSKPSHSSTPRQPGRPKDESIHQEAIQATLAILGERGFDQLTFEAVALKAGVSRPALYRRWNKKEDLIAEALETQRTKPTVPNTGNLRADLRQAAADFMAHYATPLGRQAILDILKTANQDKPTGQAWAVRYGAPRTDTFRIMFTRAIERGELSPLSDVDTIMRILSSVLLQACLMKDLEPSLKMGQNIDAVIDFVLQQKS